MVRSAQMAGQAPDLDGIVAQDVRPSPTTRGHNSSRGAGLGAWTTEERIVRWPTHEAMAEHWATPATSGADSNSQSPR